MAFTFLRDTQPEDVQALIAAFDPKYRRHWEEWLGAVRDPIEARAERLHGYLGSWGAIHGSGTSRADVTEIIKVLRDAEPHLRHLGNHDVRSLAVARHRKTCHDCLKELWMLSAKTYRDPSKARLVGRSKTILFLTDGRFGPAFDRKVCSNLFGGTFPAQTTCGIWLAMLTEVANDILAYEEENGSLEELVAGLHVGRIYDMAAWSSAPQDQE